MKIIYVSDVKTRLEARRKMPPAEFVATLGSREKAVHAAPYNPQVFFSGVLRYTVPISFLKIISFSCRITFQNFRCVASLSNPIPHSLTLPLLPQPTEIKKSGLKKLTQPTQSFILLAFQLYFPTLLSLLTSFPLLSPYPDTL